MSSLHLIPWLWVQTVWSYVWPTPRRGLSNLSWSDAHRSVASFPDFWTSSPKIVINDYSVLTPTNSGTFSSPRARTWVFPPNYVPHSPRHGAASHDSLRGLSVEEILRLGRWASTKSARLYIQSTQAVLISMNEPKKAIALGRALAEDIASALALTQLHRVK